MFNFINKKVLNKFLCIYLFVLLIIFIVVAFFFFQRFPFDLNSPIENWVNTASYFNNILTPILLAITSALIFVTWRTSKKELETTNSSLNLDFNFKIFEGMLRTFVNVLNEKIEKDVLESAFERAWKFLVTDFNESKLFNQKLIEQYNANESEDKARKTLKEKLKTTITNKQCLELNIIENDFYYITRESDAIKTFESCFNKKLFMLYQNGEDSPKCIKLFIDILKFIDEQELDDKNKVVMVNYIEFFVEPPIINKLKKNCFINDLYTKLKP